MSLDVYLKMPGARIQQRGTRILVREGGMMVDITREEWDERNPGQEPCVVDNVETTDTVYARNITHNLVQMAKAAGLYEACWRPEENGVTKAIHLVPHLIRGLEKLRGDRVHFETMNPENGWGSYEGLCDFVESYLKACSAYPDALVEVWR